MLTFFLLTCFSCFVCLFSQNVFDQDSFAWHNVFRLGNPCPELPSQIRGETRGDASSVRWIPCWQRTLITRRSDKGPVEGYRIDVDKTRSVDVFLGIPYARPPRRDLRFKKPEEHPEWRGEVWNATRYKHACPQPLKTLRFKDDVLSSYFNRTDEDCLYLNVFSPYRSVDPSARYRVLVFIHGQDWINGVAQMYPGHFMAMKDIVVVTFDYRLGALGFLSTEDEKAVGNYGLHDQRMALSWVKKNIDNFNGDPRQITVMGHGTGAASLGLHLLDKNTNGLFQQAIMLSGSDLSESAVIRPEWKPKEYAVLLAARLNCPFDNSQNMLECLRLYRTDDEIADATLNVQRKPGTNAGPFAPVIDKELLSELPEVLRRGRQYRDLPLMMGMTRDEAAWHVAALNLRGVEQGVSVRQMDGVVRDMLEQLRVYDPDNVQQSVMFEYTYWPQPDNDTARRQMLIDLYTDRIYGNGSAAVLKFHLQGAQLGHSHKLYSYVFAYRAQHDKLPDWMGCPHTLDLEYVFGWPFLNYTWQNETILLPRVLYTDMDRNISDFMLSAVVNFTNQGRPTNAERDKLKYNASWYEYNNYNHSYMYINNEPEQKIYWRRDIDAAFRKAEKDKRAAIKYLLGWWLRYRHKQRQDPSKRPDEPYDYRADEEYMQSRDAYTLLWRGWLRRQHWGRVFQPLTNYRQDKFAYWSDRFYLLQQLEFYSTPLPVLSTLSSFGIATYALAAAVFLLLVLALALCIAIWVRRKDNDKRGELSGGDLTLATDLQSNSSAPAPGSLGLAGAGSGPTATVRSMHSSNKYVYRPNDTDLFSSGRPTTEAVSERKSLTESSSDEATDYYPYGTAI